MTKCLKFLLSRRTTSRRIALTIYGLPPISLLGVLVRLTKRDEQLFRFLLDQRFASLEAIYLKFFDRRVNVSDPFPKNLFVTRQRLGLLVKEGFLKTERVYTEAKSLYLLSNSGFQYLKEHSSAPLYASPAKTVDFRQYQHDLRATYCRIALERARRAFGWISERQIRMHGFEAKGVTMPDDIVPDGIFLNAKGQRIAFELESSNRKFGRFQRKASDYQSLIAQGFLDRVLWIACDPKIQAALIKATGASPPFMIGNYQEFHSQLFPGGNR